MLFKLFWVVSVGPKVGHQKLAVRRARSDAASCRKAEVTAPDRGRNLGQGHHVQGHDRALLALCRARRRVQGQGRGQDLPSRGHVQGHEVLARGHLEKVGRGQEVDHQCLVSQGRRHSQGHPVLPGLLAARLRLSMAEVTWKTKMAERKRVT